MSETVSAGARERAHRALHVLWTKARGHDDYIKAEWLEMEMALRGLRDAERAEERRRIAEAMRQNHKKPIRWSVAAWANKIERNEL